MTEDSLESIERELEDLMGACTEEAVGVAELQRLFAPLRPVRTKAERWAEVKTSVGTVLRWGVMAGLLVLVALLLTDSTLKTNIRFHGLAVVRIALIKLLPMWNWTDLYYSRCLVRNPFFEDQELRVDDCNLCETLESIERLWNVSQEAVIEKFIRRERPLIVTDAMADWPIMKTDHFWFDNITELYVAQEKYWVCNLNTNLRMGPVADLARVLRQLYSPRTEQWFLHWENCQKDGAKATRQFYRRPYFITNSLDFTGPNWVLMASDFRGRVYKKLEVRESLSMLYQMRGSNHMRLSPRETCRDHCPELTFRLYEGEILVVPTLLWTLEYIPGEGGDNLGVLSEVSWPALD